MPPLIYDGPNAALVNEVIACAFGPSVLTGTGAYEAPQPITVITNMRAAVDAAGGVGSRGRIRIERSEMQRLMNLQDLTGYELELDWHDLQSNLLARFIWTSQYYPWNRKHESQLEPIKVMAMRLHDTCPPVPLLIAYLTRRLPDGPVGPDRRPGYYREYIAEQAACDLMYCAENRAFNGLTDNYWEMLFRTYRAGLWPCGWDGTWPAPGKLLAWRPPAGT